MEPTIKIYRGYTYAAVSVLQDSPVARYVGDFVRERLVENEWIPEHNEFIGGFWRKVRGHYQQKCMYAKYNKKTQKLHIPISYADELIRELQVMNIAVAEDKISDYPLREVDVQMKPEFHDQEHQVELIKKCSERIPGMKGLAMQTGKGKTYSAIKSWCNLGYAGLVIVNGLMDQWIKSLLEFTNVDKDYVYKLQEFKSLALLAQNPDYKPSFIVASLKTVQLFSGGAEGYELLPWDYPGFVRAYGIGVKIIDEVHQCFHATTLMDLQTNVPYNLYCSATFTQSSKQAREIFSKIYPRSMQYGIDMYDKYVEVFMYAYYGSVLEKRCVRQNRGYQHPRYEKELMSSERKFNSHLEELIYPIINQHFINRYKPGYKALIFCASLEFIEAFVMKLRREYPDKKVISYVGGDELSVLDTADIVVSTPGKSSTGLDLKGLIMALNLVSSSAEVRTMQSIGRLRKRDDIKLHYVDVFDKNISRQIDHAASRRELLKSMCSKYFEYDGFNDLSVQTGEIAR